MTQAQFKFAWLPIESLLPNPLRPRSKIKRESLLALADSIRRHGVLLPILVAHSAAGWQIIAGERRVRAAKLAGLEELPAIIRQVSSFRELALLSLAENIHREELNLLDQARVLQYAREKFAFAVEELAEQTGLDTKQIVKILKVLDLPGEIQTAYLEGRLRHKQLWDLLDHSDAQLLFQEANL